MTQQYKTRSMAVGKRASEGVRIDDVDTDNGMVTPDDHPFAANRMNVDFTEQMNEADIEEGTANALSFWVNDRDDAHWMNNWSGRVETHSMFRRSYE